ncbi:hypothetical protein E2C01_079641 [Portunus trituberculatus]|uniref:Uncharacterized protein n=1 Tax=Portunus trituberculatus TaxID=210409 RepID=A0A5B7IK32_PORTR|nr:hypothetical protein [Portunus trituberculatus]
MLRGPSAMPCHFSTPIISPLALPSPYPPVLPSPPLNSYTSDSISPSDHQSNSSFPRTNHVQGEGEGQIKTGQDVCSLRIHQRGNDVHQLR